MVCAKGTVSPICGPPGVIIPALWGWLCRWNHRMLCSVLGLGDVFRGKGFRLSFSFLVGVLAGILSFLVWTCFSFVGPWIL